MEVMKYGDLRLDQEKKNILKVNSVAYMDDTTYIAKDKKQLERILKKVEEFSKITGIRVNAEKSHLFCINRKFEKQGNKKIFQERNRNKKNSIKFMGEKIIAKRKDEYIRILGVWISADGKKNYQKMLIEEKTKNICKLIKLAKVTDKGARYIINHVLFPALEYLVNDMYLNENMSCVKKLIPNV